MTAPAHIAMVASEYPPYVFGGLGTHVVGLSTALASLGVRVDLFVPARGGYQDPPPAVTLHPIPTQLPESDSGAGYWIEFGRAAVNRASQLQPFSLVHCHDWMTAVAGAGMRSRFGSPLVFSVHLPQLTHPHLELELLGLTMAAGDIVYSHAMRRELEQRYNGAAECQVLRNGIDTDRYQPPPGNRRPDCPVVLFAGRLVPGKGADVLLRAFPALLDRLPEARLVIAGDGDEILFLQRLGRHLGLPPRLEFVGWQTGDDLLRLYQEATAVVVPSRYEPFGLVAIEAMSCGRPVIASDTGGLAEIITNDESGFLFPVGDHLALARQLYRVLADERAWRRVSAAARQRALTFSWADVASETVAFYQDVIRGQAANRPSGRNILHILTQLVDQGAESMAEQVLESLLP
jgi:glycosyltransferase involved in cell wall biosynthesis